MAYEYFYPGASDSLDPNSDSLYVGYHISAATVGASTGAQTANQIKDVANYLNQGMKVIEVGSISPEVFDMIPKQHLKEINRLTKLTGSEVSVHAPIIEPSGFTQQGWSEQNREIAERQMTDTVLRSHELNKEGEIPVTFHASAIPGTEFVPIDIVKDLTEEEKEKWGATGRIPSTMVAVNQETGEMTSLRREKMFAPYEPEGKIYTPERRLKMTNDTQWTNRITNLAFYKKEADEVLLPAYTELAPLTIEGKATPEQLQEHAGAFQKLKRAELFLDNVQMSFRGLYEEAAKFGDDPRTKEVLKKISKEWQELAKEAEKKGGKMNEVEYVDYVIKQSVLLDDSLNLMRQAPAPKLFKPVEEFVQNKASETFSNVALKAYSEYGTKAPIVSIENPPYGGAVATAQDLKKLIEESRSKFIEKAVKEGFSKSEAEKAAKQMIGATWDTSHISMMRKQGFKPEVLVEEAKKIAPFVKHVHLNDNFGYSHTDLPPGMANVPLGDIMREFEKKGFKGKKIFEGGQFFQQFQIPPHAMVLEAMGSPLYSMLAQPTWTQAAGTYGTYSSGYGLMLPEQHFSLYGAGFSALPTELGGQIPGRQSRLSGTPNA